MAVCGSGGICRLSCCSGLKLRAVRASPSFVLQVSQYPAREFVCRREADGLHRTQPARFGQVGQPLIHEVSQRAVPFQ
jgi:hypothetical protein